VCQGPATTTQAKASPGDFAPLFGSIQLPLPIPTLVDSRTPVISDISVDPLLPRYREERGEKRL